MAKKLFDIKKDIENQSSQFYTFFYDLIDNKINEFISQLLSRTNVYVFSGIIRDFFLHNNITDVRDIDLIIEDDLALETIFHNLNYTKNNFGGYKIKFDSTIIDIWVIKKTWALNHGQLKFEFDHIYSLPDTTFFNFSSIIYSLNEKDFIIGKDFIKFMRDRKIDVVLEDNPYPILCIINTFYYAQKLNLEIGDKLRSYLVSNYKIINNNVKDFDTIQLKHFNNIIFTKKEIQNKIKDIKKTMPTE